MKNILEKSVLIVVILIPIGFFAYAMWGQNIGTSNTPSPAQNTSPAPAATTPNASISLNDASALPQSVATQQLVPFSFTINNTGTTGGSIPFKVYVKWSTGEQDVIDENVVSLAAGQSTTISEQLKFEVANETAQIYLELTGTSQAVEFTLPKTN